MAIGTDLNKDGIVDIVSTSAMTSVLIGTGGGQYMSKVDYAPRGREIGSGDLDADTDIDLVTSDGSTNTTYVMLNSGTGTFPKITPYVGEEVVGFLNEFAVALGDVNGGRATRHRRGGLERGTCDPTSSWRTRLETTCPFVPTEGGRFYPVDLRYGMPGGPLDVVVADFNGDRKLDIAGSTSLGSAFTTPRGVSVLLRLG